MRCRFLPISVMRSRCSRPRVVPSMISARSMLGKSAHGQRQLVLGIVDVAISVDDDLLVIPEQLAQDSGLVCHFEGSAYAVKSDTGVCINVSGRRFYAACAVRPLLPLRTSRPGI